MDQPRLEVNQQNSSYRTYDSLADTTDYTVTFVIGFCVLAAFLILGVVASAYLCVTLKKGTLLWVTDSSRQLNKDRQEDTPAEKEDKNTSLKDIKSTSSQETTQI
ncbi:uncharacterized protein LOC143206936 [Rhynchophorus ferrugineus]|uniref:uncharacterized protein LOC143206936 n=1 Tax=Rhynchophorus ferrugineus TaxID=354439 RepID=UPI003FCECFA1